MKLHEYQSKALLARFRVPVPKGEVASDPQDARRIANELGGKAVVKAQVLMGGRGKAGGVKLLDNANEVEAFTKELIGKRLVSPQNPSGMVVEKVLVAEIVEIAEEYYVAVLLDRDRQTHIVMLSAKGGMDIEEVARTEPEAIHKIDVDAAWGVDDFRIRAALNASGIPKEAHRGMTSLIKSLSEAYLESDAELVEINPCALTPTGAVIAADAKVSIDDNALFRHPQYKATADDSAEDPIEAEAARRGIAYVRLGGEIGILGNGAGLVMCSMDEVKAAGGTPANFLDVGGGAQADRVKSCVELVLMDDNVRGILINIFGGITRCDEVAKGILSAIQDLSDSKDARFSRIRELPIVARIEGTAAEEGRAILEGSSIIPAKTMQEAAAKIVELAQTG
jgi:succinyl-CoA synthetase beta subunit